MVNRPLTLLGKRILCLIVTASLMGCGSGHSKYVWRDLGPSGSRAAQRAATVAESWGISQEEANKADPDVAPGFLLTLSSVADRQLNGEFRVDHDGSLSLPYGVTLHGGGLPLSQLKAKLNSLYQPYFKNAADIEVKVKERRYWVDVRGLVQKPGLYLVERNASLDLVIMTAGGVEKQTTPQFVRIQKGSKIFVVDLKQYYGQGEDYAQILGWMGGELIFLQKDITSSLMERLPSTPYRLPVYMMGEVQKPGEYTVKPGTDFLDALIQAGGFTNTANLKRIELIRRTGGKQRVFEFEWENFQRAPAPVQGDVILVHSERQVGSERKIHIAALITSMLASIALIYDIAREDGGNR